MRRVSVRLVEGVGCVFLRRFPWRRKSVWLLDETSHVRIAVRSTYCLFCRRIEPYHEADGFPCFARMTFLKKVDRCCYVEISLAYKSRHFDEPPSRQQNSDSPLKTDRVPPGLKGQLGDKFCTVNCLLWWSLGRSERSSEAWAVSFQARCRCLSQGRVFQLGPTPSKPIGQLKLFHCLPRMRCLLHLSPRAPSLQPYWPQPYDDDETN